MDWLIGVLLLIAGAIIGFFVAKHFIQSAKSVPGTDSDAEQTKRELMLQQASAHLQECRLIADQISAKSDDLRQHIESYEQQVISQSNDSDGSASIYFGEHAATYLRNSSQPTKRDDSNADIQPLDFSAESSGLFSGSDEKAEKDLK